jgi:hypothetical protein
MESVRSGRNTGKGFRLEDSGKEAEKKDARPQGGAEEKGCSETEGPLREKKRVRVSRTGTLGLNGEGLYASLFGNNHAIMLLIDPDSGNIVDANPAARYCKDVRGFSPEAMDILLRKDYPGNIRQLSQIVENAVLLADSTTITPRQLGEEVPPPSLVARSLVSSKENYEMHVVFIFNHFRGDRKQTAQALGITVRQLQRKLAEMKKSTHWKHLIGDF